MQHSREKWFKPGRTGLLLAGIAALVFAAWLFYTASTRPRIKSGDDLYLITDRFRDYNWDSSGKEVRLSFKLMSYKDKFQVAPEFYTALDKEEFKKFNLGDSITVGIAGSSRQYLNSRQKRLRVFSIASKNKSCLEASAAIRIYNRFPFYLAGGFLILAAITAFYGRVKFFSEKK